MALSAAGGVGDTLTRKSTVHGSEKAWLIVRFTLLAAAGCSTFASNASDWQRNATKPSGEWSSSPSSTTSTDVTDRRRPDLWSAFWIPDVQLRHDFVRNDCRRFISANLRRSDLVSCPVQVGAAYLD